MKKLLQNVFCHRTIEVVDAPTGRKEKATYIMLFGLSLSISYKALQNEKL